MGLFDAIGSALGIKTKKNNSTGSGGIAGAIGGAIGGSSNKPVATDHTHGSKEKRNAAEAQRSNSESVDIGSISNLGSFMGKGQIDKFSSFTDPSSVDRSGRAISPDSLDPVGIEPAMNPPMATPTDIDQQGVNSLYS